MNEATWTVQYLQLLQLERRDPTLEYLGVLTARHLQRFPFENISKISYYLRHGADAPAWLPDGDTFLRQHANEGWGGNCYALNSNFGTLLRALGYSAEIVSVPEGHMALRVTVEGTHYYTDVGYGAPLFEPLRLEEEPAFTRCGEQVSIKKLSEDRFFIDRYRNGKQVAAKTIEWRPVSLASFYPAIVHSLRDGDDNTFMRKVVVTQYRPGAAISVTDRKLHTTTADGLETTDYPSRTAWIAMMRQTFGFTAEALEEVLRFLAERGINWFESE